MFIVRSFPRCGTHMVRTALCQHPKLHCHDEIFNHHTVDLDDIKERGPAGNLDHFLNGPNVGCVMHAYTEKERFKGSEIHHEAWDYVAEHQDKYQVFVLFRRDWVRRMASVAVSRQTKRWHDWRSQSNRPARPAVEIHPEFADQVIHDSMQEVD